MGTEIAFERLPTIQKKLITKCRLLGKRVITATEMLESMIHNPRPTRAEISDVANAVYDGTSAIMLSGETAAGKHPVLTVQTMSRIAEETERNIDYRRRFRKAEIDETNVVDAISHAACDIAINLRAKAIVVCTMTGKTAQLVSRFRSPVPIIGVTTDEKAYRRMALSWNVFPMITEHVMSSEVMFYNATKVTQRSMGLVKGDRILLVGGLSSAEPGGTNLIKVETL
jgi:pyruvate kinase